MRPHSTLEGDKSKILFVDDETQITETLSLALTRRSKEYEIVGASSVDEAMRQLASHSFDVVVTDVQMPGKSGFDLLNEIRSSERLKTLPVIVITGMGDQEMKRQAIDSGADDLLAKPVSVADLVARLKSALRIKRYQDELRHQNENLEQVVANRTAQLEMARVELLWRLGVAGEFRDNETGNHVLRVGYFTRELSRALGLDDEFSETVFLAAPLHDIGKIGIPDSILLKPGKLTDTEWVTMRRHTEFGAQILRSRFVDPRAVLDEDHVPGSLSQTVSDGLMLTAANIALNHHERWDGSGYPNGISGEEIPIEARLTTIADVYDALSSVRPYKPAFPEEKVLSIMREGVGTQFDPAVFDAFERSLDIFRSIQRSLRDTEDDFAKLPTASKPAG